MPENFNKNLAVFLTSCRESAIKELTESNETYRQLLAEIAKYSKIIQKTLPDEYEVITDTFHVLGRI